MAERVDRTDAGRGRPATAEDERRVAEMPEIDGRPQASSGDEKTPAATGYLGMQARMFFTVIAVGAIMVIAIIVFAVTR